MELFAYLRTSLDGIIGNKRKLRRFAHFQSVKKLPLNETCGAFESLNGLVCSFDALKAGYIYLTDEGKEIAEMILERHELITEILVKLGVDEEIAAEDACRIEHVISKESFKAVRDYAKDKILKQH